MSTLQLRYGGMMPLSDFIKIDAARMKVVYEETATGSEPGARFYILVAVSTLIACFGLVANSTAVVIGAMLVAPLMTPIFGISLGLVRSDIHLFRHSVKAEIVGVIAAIAMGFLVGFTIILTNPLAEATSEMLARTKPNLFDLLVAVLAGFAGTYALIDEKISPALPGVAIATAIVPPLANCGLCLAFGAYHGAWGSFLLFFANFLSILIVASILFSKAGMAGEFGALKKADMARRFGWAAVSFLIIAALLGNALYRMMERRKLYKTVQHILVSEFSEYPATGIDRIVVDKKRKTLFVLAELHSPSQMNPNQVQEVENELTAQTKVPTELIVRIIKSTDISSSGSNSTVTAQGLDGFFVSTAVKPEIEKLRLSEQVIREYLDDHIGLDLLDVDYIEIRDVPTLLAMITGIRRLTRAEIGHLESLVRKRTKDPMLSLILRFVQIDLFTRDGPMRYGWTTLIKISEKQRKVADNIRNTIENAFADSDSHLLEEIHTTITDDEYIFLIEISSSATYNQADRKRLQEKLMSLSDKPVSLYVWVNHGVVLTDQGAVSYNRLTESHLKNYGDDFKQRIKEIIKSAR